MAVCVLRWGRLDVFDRFWGKYMTIGVEDASTVQGAPVQQVTLGWFLRRSLLGLVILAVAMGGLAWLTYASIDPDLDGDLSTKARHGALPAARVVPVDL